MQRETRETGVTFPKIKHHGAVQGVTGSCHELQVSDASAVLIDCGLFQGMERSAEGADSDRLAIDFPVETIEALLVTHCHIDHVGRIPYLLAAGFKGPIYCSEPTAVLLPQVLEDAVKVGFTRDRQLIERFLGLLKSRLRPVSYGSWVEPNMRSGSLRFQFRPAGHILGSAYIECVVGKATPTRVLFSGDLGAPYSPLLAAPQAPYGTDILVLESTYGDRLHEGRRERRLRLRKIVERCLHDRGVVLIPAFSIGRTQELLYELEEIIHRFGEREITTPQGSSTPWKDVEIIVDSPLASRFTDSYRQLWPYWDREARNRKKGGRHPLSFEQLTTLDNHQDHLRMVDYLKRSTKPCIVLAASGMCAGGRIVNYLKALLGEPRTDILFVGFQAAGTPGRAIQQYGPQGGYVVLDGKRFDIAAGVHSLPGYSAHADRDNLLNFVGRMRRVPREIRLIHGDERAKRELQAAMQARFPGSRVTIP